MELVVANVGFSDVREETLHGRKFLVAKATTIVPGVMHGSSGGLLYPQEHIQQSIAAWNGRPLTAKHPMKDGVPVSANSPKVLEEQGIGNIYNSSYEGKLLHEAWVDIDRANAVDPRIVPAMRAGKPIAVSTGLYTTNTPAVGEHNGAKYTHIASDYKPDHLAILMDEEGACTTKQGCGINVNRKGLLARLKEFVANACSCHDEPEMSAADKATVAAKEAGTRSSHIAAAMAHLDEATAYELQGNAASAAEHRNKAVEHREFGETITANICSTNGVDFFAEGDKYYGDFGTQLKPVTLLLTFNNGSGDVPVLAAGEHDTHSLETIDYMRALGMTEQVPAWVGDRDLWGDIVANVGQLDDSIHWATVAHIYRQLNGSIAEENPMALTKEQRAALVGKIVANNAGWKGGETELATLSDERLLTIGETPAPQPVVNQLTPELLAQAFAQVPGFGILQEQVQGRMTGLVERIVANSANRDADRQALAGKTLAQLEEIARFIPEQPIANWAGGAGGYVPPATDKADATAILPLPSYAE